jgi:hypothetical protein
MLHFQVYWQDNILLRIREVPGLNLGAKTGYTDCFRGFSQSLQANDEIVP